MSTNMSMISHINNMTSIKPTRTNNHAPARAHCNNDVRVACNYMGKKIVKMVNHGPNHAKNTAGIHATNCIHVICGNGIIIT